MSDYDQNPDIVKQVQTAINAMGYQPPLVVDGAYGPMTQAGVQWFQSQHGLTVDGIIGDVTLAATISFPTPSGPALVPPVTTLPSGQKSIKLNLHGLSKLNLTPQAAPQAGPPKAIPLHLGNFAQHPLTGIPGAVPPHLQAKKVSWPTWLGLVAGTVVGTLVGGPPLGTAIGAVVGGAGGAGTSALINKKHAPALGAKGATMHGEVVPFGCEVPVDDAPIVAGDMGVPVKYSSLRG